MFFNYRKRAAPEDVTINDIPSFGSGVSAAAQLQLAENPATQLARVSQLRELNQEGPLIPVEELKKRFDVPGLEFDAPMTERAAMKKAQWKKTENALTETSSAAEGGVAQFTSQMAVRLGAGMLDPINVGVSLIPVGGQARMTSFLATAGKSGAQRFAARAAAGALDGAVGGVIASGITATAAEETGLKYGTEEFLMDVTLGTVMGTALHAGGGALGDAFSNMAPGTRRELQRVVLNRAFTGDSFDGIETLALQDEFFAKAEDFYGRRFTSLSDGVEGVNEYKAFINDREQLTSLIGDIERMNNSITSGGHSDATLKSALDELKSSNSIDYADPRKFEFSTSGKKVGPGFTMRRDRAGRFTSEDRTANFRAKYKEYRELIKKSGNRETPEQVEAHKEALKRLDEINAGILSPREVKDIKDDIRDLVSTAERIAKAKDIGGRDVVDSASVSRAENREYKKLVSKGNRDEIQQYVDKKRGVERIYLESDVENTDRFWNPTAEHEKVFEDFAANPKDAIGERKRGGILIEVDRTKGGVHKSSLEGRFDFYHEKKGKSSPDRMIAITVKPDAVSTNLTAQYLKNRLAYLEKQGWVRTQLPDGSVRLDHPDYAIVRNSEDGQPLSLSELIDGVKTEEPSPDLDSAKAKRIAKIAEDVELLVSILNDKGIRTSTLSPSMSQKLGFSPLPGVKEDDIIKLAQKSISPQFLAEIEARKSELAQMRAKAQEAKRGQGLTLAQHQRLAELKAIAENDLKKMNGENLIPQAEVDAKMAKVKENFTQRIKKEADDIRRTVKDMADDPEIKSALDEFAKEMEIAKVKAEIYRRVDKCSKS